MALLALWVFSGVSVRFLLFGLSGEGSPLEWVGEVEWLPLRYPFSDGRDSGWWCGLSRAGTPLAPGESLGDGGEPFPFTAVKAGAKESTGLSLNIYGGCVLMTERCKTADILWRTAGVAGLAGQ